MLAFMIVLLPLRGWVGDAMATGMATGMAAATSQYQQVATEMVADHGPGMGVAGHFYSETAAQEQIQVSHDCAGHASDQPSQTTGTHDGHCDSCQSCQACHTVAVSPTTATVTTTFNALGLPHAAAAQFTSAQAALNQKPPIS